MWRSRNLSELEEGMLVEVRCWWGGHSYVEASKWNWGTPLHPYCCSFHLKRFGLWEQKGRKGEGKANPEGLWVTFFFLCESAFDCFPWGRPSRTLRSRYNLPRFIKLGRACLLACQTPQEPNSHSYWNRLLGAPCYPIFWCARSLWGNLTDQEVLVTWLVKF